MNVDRPNEVEPAKIADAPAPPAQRWWMAVLALAVVAGLVVLGIVPRKRAEADLAKETEAHGDPNRVGGPSPALGSTQRSSSSC